MASSSPCSVKILEITQIKPSPKSPKFPIESSLPLTFFDTYWFSLQPVEELFFYKLKCLTPAHFSSEILPKLKQSLSLTLHHYLPIAGSLRWPSNASKPIISCTDNGVSLTVAESDADFDRLTSDGVHGAVELHPLVPRLVTSDDSASILSVQITLFPNKGVSIGLTAHHMVLDGKTTAMFMKSWGYICRQGCKENSDQLLLPPELIPSFDREIIKDSTGINLDMFYLNLRLKRTNGDKSLKLSTDKGAAPGLVRATVTITPEDLKKMRKRVLSESSDGSKQLRLSPFVLTLGYVTSCIVKARGGASDGTVFLGFIADCRQRLEPPAPETYFGNCLVPVTDVSKARGYMEFENGFGFAAEKISNMVKGLTEKGVLEGAEDWDKSFLEIAKEPAGSVQVIRVSGSPRLDLYKTDFGWGTPWKVFIVSIDRNEAISMAESRDGNGGIEVGLALKKHEMERFLSMFINDVLHRNFVSKM